MYATLRTVALCPSPCIDRNAQRKQHALQHAPFSCPSPGISLVPTGLPHLNTPLRLRWPALQACHHAGAGAHSCPAPLPNAEGLTCGREMTIGAAAAHVGAVRVSVSPRRLTGRETPFPKPLWLRLNAADHGVVVIALVINTRTQIRKLIQSRKQIRGLSECMCVFVLSQPYLVTEARVPNK